MGRNKKFVDLPVSKEFRLFLKRKKGKKSYEKYLGDILNFDFGEI